MLIRISISIAAAIIYQYITTISEEVQFMWSWKPSKAKMNMLLNRYSLLLYACVNIIAFFPWSTVPVSAHAFFLFISNNNCCRGAFINSNFDDWLTINMNFGL